MGFTIETTDIDLGDTPIENIFINDFMPMANGTYVKVYLLGYKYANDRDDSIKVNNETLSKHLNIPLVDVINAWDFWEDKGIIKKHFNDDNNHNYTVEFLNLKQLYINNVIKPSLNNDTDINSGTASMKSSVSKPYSCSPQDLVEAKEIPAINQMFNEIANIIRRPLVPNECKLILEWIYNYNMSTDVIIKAYQYASEKRNKKNIHYIHGIIRNWYDEGITNIEALEEYFATNDTNYYKHNRILRALGIKGNATDEQKRLIDKWFNKWSFNMEVVLKACDETIKIREPNFKYVDGILAKWYKDGIKTVEDIEKSEEKFKKEKGTPSNNSYSNASNVDRKKIKTKFHNFKQRTSQYTAKELEEKVRHKFTDDGL